MPTQTVTPAYGRDYTTQRAALDAWNQDLDFMLHAPTREVPCNRQDMNRVGAPTLKMRFGKLQKVMIIKRKPDGTWVKA